jgi:hypothetical protein
MAWPPAGQVVPSQVILVSAAGEGLRSWAERGAGDRGASGRGGGLGVSATARAVHGPTACGDASRLLGPSSSSTSSGGGGDGDGRALVLDLARRGLNSYPLAPPSEPPHPRVCPSPAA